jgi:2-oxo-3-hexenedioate decarboxylase
VLGSPLLALGHVVELLADLPGHPSLEASEIVTTGTLTAALPVATGQTWSTRFEGLDMPGFSLRLV